MKKSKFFARMLLLSVTTVTLVACGSDDDGVTVVETPVDVAAIYSVNTPKEIKDYTAGESLATVTDADGAITEASGSALPTGTALNGTTGALTVSDVDALVAGSNTVDITTTDATGGTTEHTITVIFNANADAAASYTVSEAKAIQDYETGESIATVADADGDVVGAILESGLELPAGIVLNTTTGELTVEDAALLIAGTFDVNITTEDALGGTTEHAITVIFNNNPDVDSVYTVTDAKAVEDYETDESIATVIDGNGDITSAVLANGSVLPAGTALNAVTGEITVADLALLASGTFAIEITTEDVNAGTTTQMVTLVFNENPLRVNINAGGDDLTFEDTTFMVDQFFVGTSMPFTPSTLPADIANTENDELYLTERFGADFGYDVALENGTYKIVLHFVELFWGAPGNGSTGGTGDRVFDVSLEGVVVKNNYDIFEDVGALVATQEEFEVTLTDGVLNIGFLAEADNAKITAIEIEKLD